MSATPLSFIARQPILEISGDVHAYELLHRSGPSGGFSGIDPSQATIDVLRTAFLSAPLESLTGGHLAFINVPEELLVQDFIAVIPPDTAVIEILETVRPSPRVIAAVRTLKASGHLIALDDFEGHENWAPLVEMADYIKVDFMLTGPGERAQILERWKRPGLRFLAEKVETRADQQEALAAGYDLFQGYFFCKPEISSQRELPRSRQSYLLLLQALSCSQPDLVHVESIIQHELSLTAGLLRYLNSAAFGVRQEITSIRQALIHLGERPLKRWGTLIAMARLGENQPVELLRTSLIRAKFGEDLAELQEPKANPLRAFLAGLFSSIDALLGMPMENAIDALGLDSELRKAILGNDSREALYLCLALSLEQGEWTKADEYCKALDLDLAYVQTLFTQAIAWGDSGLNLLH